MNPVDDVELKIFEASGDLGIAAGAGEFIREVLKNEQISVDQLCNMSIYYMDTLL
jgi:hypothetical protein